MLIIYYCSTNALNLIFLNSIQNSHGAQAKQAHWKFAAIAYYHREKPNLKSVS